MIHNNDFKHDLKVGQLAEGHLDRLLNSKTIEVKCDFGGWKTGNFYVEYESRNKPSGLATTQADYWCIYIMTERGQRLQNNPDLIMDELDIKTIILLPSSNLKAKCKTHAFRKSVKGGNNNSSLGCLIKIKDLI